MSNPDTLATIKAQYRELYKAKQRKAEREIADYTAIARERMYKRRGKMKDCRPKSV